MAIVMLNAFPICLILATLMCSLVAGFLFAFAVVVMPGIKSLDDKGFIRAFQAIDRVIQNQQPLFMLVWAGSVVALIAATALGFGQLDASGRLLIICAALTYVLGVQIPTISVNVPLNNRLQELDVDSVNNEDLHAARGAFERRWNQWNVIRTALSISTAALLIILVFRL